MSNLESELKKILNQLSFKNEVKEVLDYAIFPIGKLFRPKIVEAISLDINQKIDRNHLLLALSIELHHNYTLIHDDLPSMDNDLLRRGKPSTHKAYGEWKAILCGDALLVASFECLSLIQHSNLNLLLRLYTKATGSKGLILGQWMDMSLWPKNNFKKIIRMHELKTSRLFQLAIVGTALLAENDLSLTSLKKLIRLSSAMGIYFQLVDDMNDFQNANDHEKEINPFFQFRTESMNQLQISANIIKTLVQDLKLDNLKQILMEYQNNQNIKSPLIF